MQVLIERETRLRHALGYVKSFLNNSSFGPALITGLRFPPSPSEAIPPFSPKTKSNRRRKSLASLRNRQHASNAPMPNWLQKMIAPTLMLWLLAVALGIASALGPQGGGMPKRAEVVSSAALSFVVASWVIADARKRGRQLCYDYDSFVYFAWPVVLPVYLFQTRGARAFLTLLCFAGIWFVAALFAAGISVAREFMSS